VPRRPLRAWPNASDPARVDRRLWSLPTRRSCSGRRSGLRHAWLPPRGAACRRPVARHARRRWHGRRCDGRRARRAAASSGPGLTRAATAVGHAARAAAHRLRPRATAGARAVARATDAASVWLVGTAYLAARAVRRHVQPLLRAAARRLWAGLLGVEPDGEDGCRESRGSAQREAAAAPAYQTGASALGRSST
jgi:hypothetical protein